ncbi:MAG: phage major capsid protein [Mycobacterium sp.]|uniref:phage major capsid protein n=1 Tax=Mycobacterium sp. TaxID=1785 RepID=UPI003F94FB95
MDLNDEAAVEREARRQLDHERNMSDYEQMLRRERSAKKARQSPAIYRDGGPHSYFADMGRKELYGAARAQEADERLRQHAYQKQFEYRTGLDTTVDDGGSFAAPDYVQAEFQAAAHALRATANLCRQLRVSSPSSSFVVPTFSSGSGAGLAPTQNTALSETDPVDVAVTTATQAVVGKAVVSRQLVDNASSASPVDQVISSDLGAAVGANVDLNVVTGLIGTSGVSTVAGTGGNGAPFASDIAAGYQKVIDTRLRKPNVIIMHPRRWLAGFANSVDLQGRPLMLPSTHPAALVGTPDDAIAAEWLGCRVVLDVNVPLTSGNGSQDYVIVGHSDDWLLFETLPTFESFKETAAANMSVTLIGREYMALVVRYPSSVCLVGPYSAPVTPGS